MKNKSPIVAVAKKVCPAVITIAISKNLPQIEGYYMMPFGGTDLALPKIKDGGKTESTRIGGGSGFIISADGLVLTSRHVVDDPEADYTVIVEPTKTYPAKIVGRDPIYDLAVLKIETTNLPYLELGDSETIELGQEVVAIGNALGEFHDTLSAGIVSGLSRFIQATNEFTRQAESLRGLIQTDAAINPGNSGGPLVDLDGKVIGINTAMVMGAQNIGFAIPINYAKKSLAEIKKYGKLKIPFLGVKYIILTKETAERHKLPVEYGAMVVREMLGEEPVIKGSAADKAGLQEFDIILEAKGEKVTMENPISEILQRSKINDTLDLKVLRKGQELILHATLDEKK